MAARGDINNQDVEPILFEEWLKLDFDKCLDKAGAFSKMKSSDYFEQGDYPVIDQGEKYISGFVNDENLLYKGELPVIIFGDHTRIFKYVTNTFAVGADGTKILKPIKAFDPKFFFYYMKSLTVPSLGYSRHYKVLNSIQVPLPPIPEQQRIVAKLDTLFGHLDALKTSLDRIPQLLKDFRQKVLTQAVTGKLTADWREGRELENEYDPDFIANMRDTTIEIPELWYWLPFESIAKIKSNLVDPNKYLEYPLIAPDNIKSETGLLINKPLVSDIMPISSKHLFEKGSIIYSKIRPYLSKLVIVDFDGLCSADMYPILSDLETRYLFYYMLSEHFLSYATTAGERTVLPKINQNGLNEIPVPVPPREEQQEIVSRVESLFVKADRIEVSYQKLKAKIERLPQALLAKAFRGELVEQLPTDGDARELLKEIIKTKAQKTEKKQARTITLANTKTLNKMELEPIIKSSFKEKPFSFSELINIAHTDYEVLQEAVFELLKKRDGWGLIQEFDESKEQMMLKTITYETKKG